MTVRKKALFARRLLAALAILLMIAASGCTTIIGRSRYNDADLRFQLDKASGPTLSQSATQTLKAYNVNEKVSLEQLDELEKKLEESPHPELVYTYIETSYLVARRSEKSNPERARELYLSSALHAYHYLFNPAFAERRDHSVFNGKLPDVALVYNGACDRLLSLALQDAEKGEREFPFANNQVYSVSSATAAPTIQCVYHEGAWRPEEYGAFRVASDCEYRALNFDCKHSGLGAPLVAIRRATQERPRPEEEYYPTEVCFPATALIKPNPNKPLGRIPALEPNATETIATNVDAYLEVYDSLYTPAIVVNGQSIPLETDYTTPIAYFLAKAEASIQEIGWRGLVTPDALTEILPGQENSRERSLQGLYMFEPYDPKKIPIVMTHGLGSSPITWMEMYNALRNASNVQSAYQFMFFFYPTGQPFWVSAATMRKELRRFRETVDPNREARALDHIVLIGHSMGGLISRMQVQESGDHIWNRISDEPLEQLEIDEETREDLREWFFFTPNPSVRRVITIASPFEGSEFANNFTQWLANRAIKLPQRITRALESSLARSDQSKIRDPKLLQTTTSVDALSPNSPIFAALDECEIPKEVALNNFIGVLPTLQHRWFNSIRSDGVVDASSATRSDVESESEIPAAHTEVHLHPKTILEVKEILARHLINSYAEIARENDANGSRPTSRGYLQPRDAHAKPVPLPPEFSANIE